MSPASNAQRTAIQQYWNNHVLLGVYARIFLRTLQFASAAIVAGIYGADLARSSRVPPTNWIYAEIVAALSMATCIIHCFVTVTRVAWTLWDLVLCVLWAACAGVFGSIYLQYGSTHALLSSRAISIGSMKAAIAFDLAGVALWLLSFLQGAIWCCHARRITRKVDRSHALGDPEHSPKILTVSSPREDQSSEQDEEKEKTDRKTQID